MTRRAVLHSALFKNGLSKGSESAPGCKVTPRCPQPWLSRAPQHVPAECWGSPSSPSIPELRTQADTLSVPGTDHTEAIKLRRVGRNYIPWYRHQQLQHRNGQSVFPISYSQLLPHGTRGAPATAQTSLMLAQLLGLEKLSTIPAFPTPSLRRTGNKPTAGQAGSSPTAQDPPPCANASSQMLSSPNCGVSSSTASKRKKMSVSPFLAVSISSSVQRELSFISREAGEEEGKRPVSCEQDPASIVSAEDVSQHPNSVPHALYPGGTTKPHSAGSASTRKAVVRLFHATVPHAQHPLRMHLSDAKPPVWAWKQSQMA